MPFAFATMVLVSRLTRHRVPVHTSRFMVRLHTPETVTLDRGGAGPVPTMGDLDQTSRVEMRSALANRPDRAETARRGRPDTGGPSM